VRSSETVVMIIFLCVVIIAFVRASDYDDKIAVQSDAFVSVLLKAPKPSVSVLRTAAAALEKARSQPPPAESATTQRRLEAGTTSSNVDYYFVGHLYNSPADCAANNEKIMSLAFPSYRGEDCSLIDPVASSKGSVASVGCTGPMGETMDLSVLYAVYESPDCSGDPVDTFSADVTHFPPRCRDSDADGRSLPVMAVSCRARSNPPFQEQDALVVDGFGSEQDCLEARAPERQLYVHPGHCLDGMRLVSCVGLGGGPQTRVLELFENLNCTGSSRRFDKPMQLSPSRRAKKCAQKRTEVARCNGQKV
jgi:hypothetical protein